MDILLFDNIVYQFRIALCRIGENVNLYEFKNYDYYEIHVCKCGQKVFSIDISPFSSNDINCKTEKWKKFIVETTTLENIFL